MNSVLLNRVWPMPKTLPRPSRKHGILVVDDDEGVRGVLSIWLRHQGYAVWLAASGPEAIDLYELHSEKIDVVLLDTLMPGMDGLETLAALQQLNPEVCCCFMIENLSGFAAGGLCDMGAAVILPKPFRLAAVSQLLSQSSTPLAQPTFAEKRRWSEHASQA